MNPRRRNKVSAKAAAPVLSRGIVTRPSDVTDAVYALWDDLDRLPMEDNKALDHLCTVLARLIPADDVKWLGAVRVLQGNAVKRDPLRGWRLRAAYNFTDISAEYDKHNAWWYQKSVPPPTEDQMGMATKAIVEGAGKFQAHRMRDGFIPYEDFRRTEHYRIHYTVQGISDRMWISFPLNENAESMFLVDRMKNKRHFTQEEIDLAAMVLRGIRWFHRRLFLNQGLLIANTPLGPTARRIVQKLLTGMTEKEIAESMNQSRDTTHGYVKAIYQQFGVNGRAALMALWLRT